MSQSSEDESAPERKREVVNENACERNTIRNAKIKGEATISVFATLSTSESFVNWFQLEVLETASPYQALKGLQQLGSLLSKKLKVKIYKTVILPVVLHGCETWTLTLRDEQRLRVFENKMLRKIFGAKRGEVTGERRKLDNTELHALYSSPDIIRNIKSRRLRWAGHVAHMGESRNAYRVLVGRPEGKRPIEKPMAGICEGGNEPPSSLKAICKQVRDSDTDK
ncbi:hypothetical protein ANN_05755 [Periplaneta americana]|uniref:Uncharacterized protein n=1 Tax=Periplaneta americana TaxID=6978 RepID=A0ABQ8TBN9_PERAM|nr:hypothetical protein ANN_05755 [Periplaneta americana]